MREINSYEIIQFYTELGYIRVLYYKYCLEAYVYIEFHPQIKFDYYVAIKCDFYNPNEI